MTTTPWGEAGALRERKLSPGPGSEPELKARNQRLRLMGGAMATFSTKGYEATRVADILEIAGVSRQTFYRHFANKQECYLATLHTGMKLAGKAMVDSYEQATGSWDERLETMMRALFDLVIAQPAGFQMAVVEVHAAGPEALDLLELMSDGVERAVMDVLRDAPHQSGLPRAAVRGILNGVRGMVATRVREGRERELPGLVPGLLPWALSYGTPHELLYQVERPTAPMPTHRTPGARGRILQAMADLVAEHGYNDLKISDIAERAAVSLTTFYDNFMGKEEAFLATLAEAQQRLLETTLPAYLSTDDWPRAIAAAARAFTSFLSTDPTAAKIGGVHVWATGGPALELRRKGLAAFAMLLDEGFARYPDTPPVAAEAIASSIDALIFDQIRRAGPERIYEITPVGIFLALSPFIGSDAAVAIANEKSAPHPSGSAPAR
jgi:AcrR family transcriptional regulator